MPDNPNLPDFAKSPTLRSDIAALSKAFAKHQRVFAQNFLTSRQPDLTDFPVVDHFAAIVTDAGPQGEADYDDGIRVWVQRASTTEGLDTTDVYDCINEAISAFRETLTASNLAAIPIQDVTDNSPPTGMVQPPTGQIVHVFELGNRGTGGSSGDGTPQTKLFVFWWAPPMVLIQINSPIADAGGKYNGTIQIGKWDEDDGMGNLDLGVMNDGRSCLVQNSAENGASTHVLQNNVYLIGFYVGMSSENPIRPIVVIPAGGGDTVWVVLDNTGDTTNGVYAGPNSAIVSLACNTGDNDDTQSNAIQCIVHNAPEMSVTSPAMGVQLADTTNPYLGKITGVDMVTGFPIVRTFANLILDFEISPGDVASGDAGSYTAGPPPMLTPQSYTYNVVGVNGTTLFTNATPSWGDPQTILTGPATYGRLAFINPQTVIFAETNAYALIEYGACTS